MQKARQYELIYIVTPESTEEMVADLQTQVEDVVSRFEAKIENTENWGKRKLAYDIGSFNEGIYILNLISGPVDKVAEMVSEIERRLRVDDKVIRYLVIRVDEVYRVAERTASRRGRDRARRRQARGLPPEVARVESESNHKSPKTNEVAQVESEADHKSPKTNEEPKTETPVEEPKTETPVKEANNG